MRGGVIMLPDSGDPSVVPAVWVGRCCIVPRPVKFENGGVAAVKTWLPALDHISLTTASSALDSR